MQDHLYAAQANRISELMSENQNLLSTIEKLNRKNAEIEMAGRFYLDMQKAILDNPNLMSE